MDPCDFLEPSEALEPSAGLREALRKQTTAAVVRRRRVRRVLLAAALAACYAAGLGTMRLWQQLHAHEAAPATANREAAAPLERPTAPAAEEDAAAPELERIASLVPADQRAALFFQAGDRYWQQTSDVQSALRCYRLALEGGPEDAWNISVHDNWLLMALKQAKQREKSYANADG